jgi:hypothetical protein
MAGESNMKRFATFLLLAGGLFFLAFFSPRVASAHASVMAASMATPERTNPASAHDRRNHRSSNLKRHHRHRPHH